MKASKENINKSTIAMAFLAMATAIVNYQGEIRAYNTTMLALSYRYGFTSRSLLGTIYHVLNDILPIDIINYKSALVFAQVITILFVVFIIGFDYMILKRCDENNYKMVAAIESLFTVVVVSTFTAGSNFLRVDLFMICVSLIAVMLLINEKCEWMVIILSALGVMFHQGYVFMYFSIILALLLYKAINSEEKRKKYIVYFVISFIVGSVLFLWFEFFSRSNGAAIYDQVVAEAKALSYKGYHTTLLYHEVLGIDLTESEETFAAMNSVQFPIYLIAILPYVILLIKFAIRIIKKAVGFWDKVKYFIVIAGIVTIVPDFLLKVDYGRWVMSVITYYVAVILALVAMNDQIVKDVLTEIITDVKKKPYWIILLIYPILLVPLKDVDINSFAQHNADWIDSRLLHLFTK